MNNITRLVFVALPLALAACNTASASTATTPTTSADVALTRERTAAALAQVPESGAECRMIAVVGAPIAAPHLENPEIQQTAGRATLASFAGGEARQLEGTVLGTVVGKRPSGEMLGNHHLLFAEGSIRTENDVITLKPTADKCVMNASVVMNFKDGTGAFAGLSGTGTAESALNFCGAPGRATIYGRVCKAK
jgi:hypothetical protein